MDPQLPTVVSTVGPIFSNPRIRNITRWVTVEDPAFLFPQPHIAWGVSVIATLSVGPHGFLFYFLLPKHTTCKGIGTSATLALDGVVEDWVKGSGFRSSRRLPWSNQNPNVVKFSRTRTYNLDTKTCLSDLPRSIAVALLSNHFHHCVIKIIYTLKTASLTKGL